MELRYRVYEPETPRDLPIGLLQEFIWERPTPPTVGEQWDLDSEGQVRRWEIERVEDDPDPAYAGRIYFKFAARSQGDRPRSDERVTQYSTQGSVVIYAKDDNGTPSRAVLLGGFGGKARCQPRDKPSHQSAAFRHEPQAKSMYLLLPEPRLRTRSTRAGS